MEVKRSDGSIKKIGRIPASDTFLLKLLYHNQPHPDLRTWALLWRNCYGIAVGIDWADIDVDVFKGPLGSEGSDSAFNFQTSNSDTTRFIEITGLDQYDDSGNLIADGKFDDRSEIFRPEWGLLIFPHRTPFDADTTYGRSDTLTEKVPAIYRYQSPTERVQASRYFLQLTTRMRN